MSLHIQKHYLINLYLFFCIIQFISGLAILHTNKPVPLKSIDVDVDIKGFIASVTAVLVYQNTEENLIEVVYKFPLDDASAVYRFEAEVEGRTIIAECQEKQLAKQTYDEAMESGYTAAYMEEAESISDIFSMRVGNIPPGGEVKITLGYLTEVKQLAESGVSRFILYTLLNPRYNPAPESGGLASPPKVTYLKDGKQPYDFSFRAKVGDSGPISNISSTKDELKVEYNADKTQASVSLSKPFIADHDLTLDISYSDPFKPHAVIEKGDPAEDGILKEDLVMLNFLPDLKISDYSPNHEFIIIIDRSGSMMGSRIKSAQETLLLFLKSLPTGCYFNIIGFGSHFSKLFPEGSVKLSEESMKAALDYQKQLAADYGGTEILAALLDVYSKPAMASHSRQLFILTDGEVFNTNEVINVVKKNAENTRVFTFGIGEGASTALVSGMARAGRGRAEFIREGERLQPIVMKTFKAAMQLGVTDLHLDWELRGSPKLIQIPKDLPPLFSGDRLIVYAVSSGQAALDGQVHLTGRIGERELNFGLVVHHYPVKNSVSGTLPLHRLAAKSWIHQLQDEENEEDSEKNKSEVILLSTASNIISHHTAMVAVDKEKSYKTTRTRTVYEVPHMLDPTLMHHELVIDAEQFGDFESFSSAPRIRAKRAIVTGHTATAHRSMGAMGRSGAMGASGPSGASGSSGAPGPSGPTYMHMSDGASMSPMDEPVSGYMVVVQLQTFSGSWLLNEDLALALELNLKHMKSTQPEQINDEVWGTALTLAVLNKQFSDNKDEWEMIELKAQQWLSSKQLQPYTLSSLLDLATAALSSAQQQPSSHIEL